MVRSRRSDGCREYRGLSRRAFLHGAGAAAVATTILPRLGFAAPGSSTDKTLVLVFLRGGMDGLAMCAPVTDRELQAKRTTTLVAVPGSPTDPAWLDPPGASQRFALPPSALAFKNAYDDGHLVFVHGCGLPNVSRSHFEAMREVEYGINSGATPPASGNGWGGGMLQQRSAPMGTPLRGLAHGTILPLTMNNGPLTQAVPDVTSLAFPGLLAAGPPDYASTYRIGLNVLASASAQPFQANAFQAMAGYDALTVINYQRTPPVAYPSTSFGDALFRTASILKDTTNPSPEMVMIDFGGWDHHDYEGVNDPSRIFWQLADDLSKSLDAFYYDMGGSAGVGCYNLCVLSEFGRRIQENQSEGTDHGHGSVMMVLGDGVARGSYGGKVFREFGVLGSAGSTANGGEDLATTVEFRDVLDEALRHSLGLTPAQVATLFPGWARRGVPLNIVG